MEILLNRFRNLTVLLLVIFAQLVLLAYQVKSNQDVRLIRVWAVTAVTPLARVLEFVRQNTIGVVQNYIVLVNVREENQRLKQELGEAKLAVHFLRAELQSADRVEALRVFQARTPSRTLPARIIGTGTGANSRVVYLDQGSAAGVMRGMAVVTPDGIVGKVIGAYPTASQVLLITDSSFAAGVVSDKNRVRGTLQGLGQAKCHVNYVQNEEKVEVGEVFYTSGDDRVFPRGLPAAKAVAVREGETFKEIYVVPTGLQTGTEEVLVVMEGVHQALPTNAELTETDVYLAPPLEEPSAEQSSSESSSSIRSEAPPVTRSSAVQTEADRLRERYQGIAEQQGVVLGQGYRAPDFKVPLAKPRSSAPGPAAPGRQPSSTTNAGQGSSGGGVQARPPAPKPAITGGVDSATGTSGRRVSPPPAATGNAQGASANPTATNPATRVPPQSRRAPDAERTDPPSRSQPATQGDAGSSRSAAPPASTQR